VPKVSRRKRAASPRIVVARRTPLAITGGATIAMRWARRLRFLIVWLAGWVNSRQLEVVDFLREENR